MKIKLKCANCGSEKELHRNIGFQKIKEYLDEFLREHGKSVGNIRCEEYHIYITI